MGNVIRQGAAISDVHQDLQDTLTRAGLESAGHLEEAERYVKPVYEQLTGLLEAVEDKELVVRTLRSERDAQNRACDDLVLSIHDQLYNQIGRVARDRWFGMLMPNGAGTYTRKPPGKKDVALGMLASTLEDHPHKMVPEETAKAHAEALRTAAAAMSAAVEAVTVAVTELEMLKAQRMATAKRAQNRLSALKKFWLAEGMTQADIHQIIPDRGPSRPAWLDDADPEDVAAK